MSATAKGSDTAVAATDIQNVSRRDFLRGSAAVGLVVAVPLGTAVARRAQATQELAPNAFVRIDSEGFVTVISKHLEMGQGSYTGMATLVAEELDADWDKVRVEGAPADTALYANTLLGAQGTGGSSAISNAFEQMRKAGATARAMLVAAAAGAWGVAGEEITVAKGVLSHPSGRTATFGELVELAALVEAPQEVTLKSPGDFVLIGKVAPRRDSAAKTTGAAQFTQDVHLPGMRVAVVAHAPRFGAVLESMDTVDARAVPGVQEVVDIDGGVAVIADDFWSAKKGRDALQLSWDESKAWRGGSDELYEMYEALTAEPGDTAAERGEAIAGVDTAEEVLESVFRFPYLAHAAMEPMNCVMHLTSDGLTVWNGEQLQTIDQMALAKFFELPPEKVKLNMLYAGGSFGRRGNPNSDYLLEAARIVMAAKADYPIKLVWSREDDTRGGFYRPLYVHRLRAALDKDGMPEAWDQRVVGQSIMKGTPFEAMMGTRTVDPTSVEGAINQPYAMPHFRVGLHTTNGEVPVTVQWWRSVGSTHTAHAAEVFIDELASHAARDPVDYRLAMLADHPRHAAVLRLAAKEASWTTPLAEKAGARRGRGVALHESFRTYVAQVVEVTVADDGSYSVDRVVCAVDCGVPVNPDVIRAQMEGGIGYALAAALHGDLRIEDGVVNQSNFHDYPVLRMGEMPKIEVHIVPSAEAPTGVGEPGVPPLAPALANALHNATGQRIRDLPIGKILSV